MPPHAALSSVRAPHHRCDPAFFALAVVSEELPRSHMLVQSAEHYGYNLRLLIVNHTKANVYSTRISALLDVLRAACSRSVVMLLDAYDVFFNMPASVALRRFHASGAHVVWSMERQFSGQDLDDKAFFDEQRALLNDSFGRPVATTYGYINTGGYMGYASTLAALVEEALTIQPGAAGWRNKTCGEAHGRHCADQWIYGHLLAKTWNRFNVSFDYSNSIFYVASSHDWAFHRASSQIEGAQPCVVHVTFIQAPRVRALLNALYDTYFLHRPPLEANLTRCRARSDHCKQAALGLNDIVRTFERVLSTSAPSQELLEMYAVNSSSAGSRPATPALRSHYASRLKQLQPALRLQESLREHHAHDWSAQATAMVREAACSGYGIHLKAYSREEYLLCTTVRNAINASSWTALAGRLTGQWKDPNGIGDFSSVPLRLSWRSRFNAVHAYADEVVFGNHPWCYEPPNGIRATWIPC